MEKEFSLLLANDNAEESNFISEKFTNDSAIKNFSIVSSGKDAEELILNNDYDLVILDLVLQEIDGFEYKYSYDNLISDIVMTYNGQTSLIDDNQVKIATEFKQFLFSENDMTLPEIVSRMLNLKGKTI